MANYYATARTSYVKVRDHKKFLAWAETIPSCEVITQKTGDNGTLYGLMFTEDGIPGWRSDEYGYDVDMDIFEEIQDHIASGWSIIFQEVGAEKCRYLSGYAVVVTPATVKHCSLDSWITETLTSLGSPLSTMCAY